MYAHAHVAEKSGKGVEARKALINGSKGGGLTLNLASRPSSLSPAPSRVGNHGGNREEGSNRRGKGDRDDSTRLKVEGMARKMSDIHAQLFQRRMCLVEKLLDVHIHSVVSNSFTELRHKERKMLFERSLELSVSTESEDSGRAARRYVLGCAPSRPSSSSPMLLSSSSLLASAAAAARSACSTRARTTASELEQTLRKHLRDECRVDAALAAERWFASPQDEGLVFVVLRQLASMSREEAQCDVRNAVAQYVDPHVKAFLEQKRGQCVAAGYEGNNGGLKSVELAIHRAVAKRKGELEKRRAVHAELRHAHRVHRVKSAMTMLNRDIGDLSHLRHVVPERYEAPQEHHAVERLRRLRVRVHQLHLEEQERQRRLETARKGATNRVQAVQEEVEALCEERLRVLQSIAAKKADIDEMQAAVAAAAANGGVRDLSWAEKTLQLELKLTEAAQGESKLQETSRELGRQLQFSTAEKNMLDVELANDEAELAASLAEKEEITRALMEGLDKARGTVLQLRCEQSRVVRELNTMRDAMLVGRTDGLSARTTLKMRMIAAVSQLALEELLHSRLTAQLQWRQEQLEKEQKVVLSLSAQQESNRQEPHMKSFERFVDLAKEAARSTPVGRDDHNMLLLQGVKSEAEIQDRIAECYDTCLRLRGDTAKLIGSDESTLLAAQRRQEQLDRQLLEWQLRQESIFDAEMPLFEAMAVGSGDDLPIPLPSAAKILEDAQPLYAAVSHALHRENRCKTILQLLQDLAETGLCAGGNDVKRLPLRSSFLSSVDSVRPSEAMKGGSVLQTPPRPHSVATSTNVTLGTCTTQVSPTRTAAWRMMVLQFIKNEIQPLYDTNRISRIRFMDVVERVSRGFLSARPLPQPLLSKADRETLCEQIQATLTWQDEQRVTRHNV